jgi:hypothetical protein
MAKSTSDRTVPNLDNATPASIIDELGGVRVEKKRLEFLEGIYKQALEARVTETQLKGFQPVQGEKYTGTYSVVTQERVDGDAVRAEFANNPEMLKKFIKVITFKQLGTKPVETVVIQGTQ